VTSASELVTEKLSQLLRNLNSAVNGSVMLFRASPRLCGVALSTVPVVGIGAMALSRFSRKIATDLRDSQSSVLSYLMERVRNVSTVRLHNREAFEMRTFNTLLQRSNTLASERFNAHGSFMSFINLSTNAALVAVLRAGGLLIANREMTTGGLISFAIQASFVGLGFSGLSSLYSDYVNAIDAATR
jgi:ABC-type bacteriocin/lantibiotic exporter with double-glycine peptidase domain